MENILGKPSYALEYWFS